MNKKLLVIALIIMVVMSINVLGGVFAQETEPVEIDQEETGQPVEAVKESPTEETNTETKVLAAPEEKSTPEAEEMTEAEVGALAIPEITPLFSELAVYVEEGATTVDLGRLIENLDDVIAAGGTVTGGEIITAEDGSKIVQAFVNFGPDFLAFDGPVLEVLENLMEDTPEETQVKAPPASPEDLLTDLVDLAEAKGETKAKMDITFYSFNIRPVQKIAVTDSKNVVVNQEMNIFINMIKPDPIVVERYSYSYGATTTVPKTGDATSLISFLGLTLSGAGLAVLRKQKW